MKHLKTLVLMQLRDKIDLSWINDKKSRIRNIVFFVLKFAIISAFSFLILYLCTLIGLFYYSDLVSVMILVITFSLILSLIACTYELMKNLYFSEDNKVLITFPVNANKIFISKIIVFFIYEIKKSFTFMIPITFACVLSLVTRGSCSIGSLFYMWIVMPFVISLPVLIGALLSIPVMYIYRFLKKYTFVEVSLAAIILVAVVVGVVKLINLIPENIDLINQWPTISKAIRSFLMIIEDKLTIMNQLIRTIIGEKNSSQVYLLKWISLFKLFVLLLVNALLSFIVYYASRPLFFKMMSKNFEINKINVHDKKNTKKNRYLTFINKEFLINLRTIDISVNYLLVYIIVPIMILLLNKLYAAMDTKQLGDNLIYAFNVLLICLPMLASNALVATYYSREGRAGYMKKAKPIFAAYPLLAKLFFNMLFSIPAIFATVSIFGSLKSIGATNIIIFGFAILFLHYAHMLWSAMLDIMNPQNEQYATTGMEVDNPNENKSSIFAFIIAFVYAVIAYKLLSESVLYHKGLTMGMSKLLFISLISFISILILFIKRIKAFYYDMQER